MSESYRSKFNGASAPKMAEPITYHGTDGHARNLCLVMADGEMLFLSYAYLVSGAFSAAAGAIMLTFTTHLVTMQGRNLSTLFDAFAAHSPSRVTALNPRYAQTEQQDENECLITELTAQPL